MKWPFNEINNFWKYVSNRDTKGMYAKARRGEIKRFTGIDDPYEPSLNPEITLYSVGHSPEENMRLVLEKLIAQGFVRNEGAQ